MVFGARGDFGLKLTVGSGFWQFRLLVLRTRAIL
jgi:hypothetical protein